MLTHTFIYILTSSRAYLILQSSLCILAKTLLYLCPAFLFACNKDIVAPVSKEKDVVINLKSNLLENIMNSPSEKETVIDIFIYNNDRLGHLDSYQRLRTAKNEKIHVASTNGEKEIFVIVNPQWETYEWNTVSSKEGIVRLYADLRKDDERNPLMTGSALWKGNEDKTLDISLRSMLSKISIRSLKCDFSSRPYNGADLENVYCWLANANTLSEIGIDSFGNVLSPVNSNGYAEDIGAIRPEMLKFHIGERIGSAGTRPGKALYCYPGCPDGCDEEEDYKTSLVISGEIHGHRYYYPITIGNIRRNCNYEFDIVITRAGSPDPMFPVQKGIAEISCRILPWEDTDESIIPFTHK